MSQIFSKIKIGNSKRSTFDLSHHQVTTSDFGFLIPICYRDMLPNDDFTVTPNIFCRLAPMISPTYGRITCRVHSFFVPYRVLFPKWSDFVTNSPSTSQTPPYFYASDLKVWFGYDKAYSSEGQAPRGTYTRVATNLGLNPNVVSNLPSLMRIAAFPFLAYQRIYMDYFMDTNLQNHSEAISTFNDIIKNGGHLTNSDLIKTMCACYKKDYFTTAKVSPQEGNPSMVGVDVGSDFNPALDTSNSNQFITLSVDSKKIGKNDVYASLGNEKIGQFTVEALRAASAAQRFSERNNFVGSKIINRILAHFGVSPTAERLDMAEYIDGDSFNVAIQDVTSTNSTTSGSTHSTLGLGLQGGKGVAGSQTKQVHYHAKEHGIFMTLMSILPDTGYYQNISRFWTKGVNGDNLDYFSPEFENLGYQELLNHEVFVPTGSDYSDYNPNGIFGYVPRYSEYKFQNDVLGGDFVLGSNNFTNIDYLSSFHLFRQLIYDNENPLALNENFVTCDNHNNNFDRIFQYINNEYDHFYFSINCDVKATRNMVGFAEPSLDSVNNEGDGQQVELPYGGTRL